VKVLVVDDHPIIRLGVRSLFETAGVAEVVGEAATARAAVDLARELQPDLVVLDLKLAGGTGGTEACREIKSLTGNPRVLVYTAFNSAEDISSCRLIGADSYLYKEEDPDKLLEVAERTHAGEHVWLVGDAADAGLRLEAEAKSAGLTPREQEVLALIIRRRANDEIAKDLRVSLTTVKTHVSSILKKLDKHSRKDLYWD
jgi:NarL family two-component system response regulator LiaR